MPYVGPILKALVSKLRSATQHLVIMPSPQGGPHMQKGAVQGGGETGVMASVLATTGELARVAGCNLRPHIGDILPLIIEAIGHPSGANKSVVAVITLGQVSVATRHLHDGLQELSTNQSQLYWLICLLASSLARCTSASLPRLPANPLGLLLAHLHALVFPFLHASLHAQRKTRNKNHNSPPFFCLFVCFLAWLLATLFGHRLVYQGHGKWCR